jgi:hypothetical protein
VSDEKTPQNLKRATGTPVTDNLNIHTTGPRGPALLQDLWLVEKLAHFDRSRMHAKGAGRRGTFTVTHELPDGPRFAKFYDTTADQFIASKQGCDVRIGTNRFVGDLHRYPITAAIEEISVEIELTGEVRAWRPKSGDLYFGSEGRETLFAWPPSVPQGVAHVRYKGGHDEYRASGSGR